MRGQFVMGRIALGNRGRDDAVEENDRGTGDNQCDVCAIRVAARIIGQYKVSRQPHKRRKQ